jgi:O-antigen ligase
LPERTLSFCGPAAGTILSSADSTQTNFTLLRSKKRAIVLAGRRYCWVRRVLPARQVLAPGAKTKNRGARRRDWQGRCPRSVVAAPGGSLGKEFGSLLMRAALSHDARQEASYWQETIQNRILLVVLGIIVLVPLLASPSNPAMQNVAGKSIQVMAALLVGILILRARPISRGRDALVFFGTGANLAVLLYFSAAVVSLLLGPKDPAVRRLSVSVFQQILAGVLLYFALAYHVRRARHLDKINDALVYVAGILSLAGLSVLAAQSTSEQAVLFGDHQLFGGFLMLLLPTALIAAVTTREPRRKIAYQICTVLTVACLVMSGLRSAWIGGSALLIALIAFSWIGSGNRSRMAQWKAQYIVPLITLAACLAFVTLQGDLSRMVSRRFAAGEKTLLERQHYWYAAGQLVITRPVFGTGLGTFPIYQYPYSLLGRPAAVVLQNRPALSEMAHNFWLQTAAEQGLIGVALFASILLTFLAAGMRRLRVLRGGIRRSLLLASMAGMVGFAVDALSNPAWQFAQVNIYLWLMLGLGVACMQPRPREREEEAEPFEVED